MALNAFKGIGVTRQHQARKEEKRFEGKCDALCTPVDTEDYGIRPFETVALDDLENNPTFAVLAAQNCVPGRNGQIFRAPEKEIHFRRALHAKKFCAKVKPSRQQDSMAKSSGNPGLTADRQIAMRPSTVPSPKRAPASTCFEESRPMTIDGATSARPVTKVS